MAKTSGLNLQMMTTKRLANVLECSFIEHLKIITHLHISEREYRNIIVSFTFSMISEKRNHLINIEVDGSVILNEF